MRPDYAERVYAAVLGKIIGVYLGRPVENWSHADIEGRFSFVDRFVNADLNLPLIVPDDDITGTLTFARALPDHANNPRLTAQQVGETWLDYIIEGRSILWWGGFGNSSEHTAYLRLKAGTPAPASGGRALNGVVVSEQIGAQIFVDGFALVAPGRPELAARLAGQAASVAHDGEAVLAAQALAVMEALAFDAPPLDALLDAAEASLPPTSNVARVYRRARELRATQPDWRAALAALEAEFGGPEYPGLVHVIPNHALILLGLLYGDGDFTRSLAVCVTAGRDTDCNAGNLGCLLGAWLGLPAIPGAWREEVCDRLYLPTSDGGRGLSDAVLEAQRLVDSGRALAGLPPLEPAKDGARFHFSLPGSLQGFTITPGSTPGRLENISLNGERALALRPKGPGRLIAATPASLPTEMLRPQGYALNASPILHSGQTLQADVSADPNNAQPLTASLSLNVHGQPDEVAAVNLTLAPGERAQLTLSTPDTHGQPVTQLLLSANGNLNLHSLGITGQPHLTLTRPTGGQDDPAWQLAFTSSLDHFEARYPNSFHLSQDHGTGYLTQGNDTWRDYTVNATLTPLLAEAFGLVARFTHQRRHYALEVTSDRTARILKVNGDTRRTLTEAPCPWTANTALRLTLSVHGNTLKANINDLTLTATDEQPYPDGAAGFTLTQGTLTCEALEVKG